MTKNRRRREKKRSAIVRRVSSFIQNYDPDHWHSCVLALGAISIPITWWIEGWDRAALLSKILFFLTLGASAGVNIRALLWHLAVKEGFQQKDLIDACVKLAILSIALIAMEDHVWPSIGISLFGFGLVAFSLCFTIVYKVISSWFK